MPPRGSLQGTLILRGYRLGDPMLRRPGPPFALAAVAAVLLAVTGVLAKLVPGTQQGDARTLHGFLDLNAPRLSGPLDTIAHLADPAPYALFGLLLALVALARRRWRLAAAIPVLFLLTGATTEALKQLLAGPRLQEWLGDGQIAAAALAVGPSPGAADVAPRAGAAR